MRPDEHKKKKNTAYKKKHGIGTGKDSSGGKADTNQKEKEERHKNSKGMAKNLSPSVMSNAPRLHNKVSSDTESGSEDEFVAKRSYRRRDIVSNWKKYDLEIDDEQRPTARGENFEKLLSMAGEAMSHFRFKDELEWENDEETVGKEQDSNTSSLLTLDLADLSVSMSCIPTHKMLGIDENLFPADQLVFDIKSAQEKRLVYENSLLNKDCSPLEKEQNKIISQKPSVQSKHEVTNNVLSASISKDYVTSRLSRDKVSKNNERQPESKEINKQEESLKDKQLRIQQQEQPEILSIDDDDLDQLLEVEATVEMTDGASAKKNDTSPSLVKKDDKKEADELEDWLDSILD